jgi:hypothetical protein
MGAFFLYWFLKEGQKIRDMEITGRLLVFGNGDSVRSVGISALVPSWTGVAFGSGDSVRSVGVAALVPSWTGDVVAALVIPPPPTTVKSPIISPVSKILGRFRIDRRVTVFRISTLLRSRVGCIFLAGSKILGLVIIVSPNKFRFGHGVAIF